MTLFLFLSFCWGVLACGVFALELDDTKTFLLQILIVFVVMLIMVWDDVNSNNGKRISKNRIVWGSE